MRRDKRQNRVHLRSALLGGLIAALAVSVLPAVAAEVGDALRLGDSNRINGRTIVRGKAAANLTIISEAFPGSGGTALDLRVKDGNAPLRVNSPVLVEGLNADQLDGIDSSEFHTKTESQAVLGAYTVEVVKTIPAGVSTGTNAACDQGDLVAGGGYQTLSPDWIIFEEIGPSSTVEGWTFFAFNADSVPHDVTLSARCLDLTPPPGPTGP